MIEKAMKEHLRLLRIIADHEKTISNLRGQKNLVREAISKFCHPTMLKSAEYWLKDNNI